MSIVISFSIQRFTATWPREIQTIAQEFLRNPIEIKFGESNTLNANKAITQIVTVLKESEKTHELKKVLQMINPSGIPDELPKTIIFVARKTACDNLANEMWNAGFQVDSLHGDKEQFQRTKVMDTFKKSQIRVLVATDVAARGLDVKDIAVVINFDFPSGGAGVDDYVHRIGRTARGSATGRAFTFFTAEDAKKASELIGVLSRAGQHIPEELKGFERQGQRSSIDKGRGGRGGRDNSSTGRGGRGGRGFGGGGRREGGRSGRGRGG